MLPRLLSCNTGRGADCGPSSPFGGLCWHDSNSPDPSSGHDPPTPRNAKPSVQGLRHATAPARAASIRSFRRQLRLPCSESPATHCRDGRRCCSSFEDGGALGLIQGPRANPHWNSTICSPQLCHIRHAQAHGVRRVQQVGCCVVPLPNSECSSYCVGLSCQQTPSCSISYPYCCRGSGDVLLLTLGLPGIRKQSPWTNLLLGAAAGTLAASVCYPLDTVRRRMQMKGHVYDNQWHALVTIFKKVREEGRNGRELYRLHCANAFQTSGMHVRTNF